MNLFQKYETDAALERDGVEVTIEGAVFQLRRAGGGNRRFAYAFGRAADRYRATVEEINAPGKSIDDPEHAERVLDLDERCTQEAFAEAVVTGWRNVDGRDGAPLEFSQAAFLDLVRSCPDVWAKIRTAATSVETFRKDGHALGKF